MTTKELVQWANNAESAREASWLEDQDNSCYKLSMTAAAEQTRPPNATERELDMVVVMLYQAWNEVQDWQHME